MWRNLYWLLQTLRGLWFISLCEQWKFKSMDFRGSKWEFIKEFPMNLFHQVWPSSNDNSKDQEINHRRIVRWAFSGKIIFSKFSNQIYKLFTCNCNFCITSNSLQRIKVEYERIKSTSLNSEKNHYYQG